MVTAEGPLVLVVGMVLAASTVCTDNTMVLPGRPGFGLGGFFVFTVFFWGYGNLATGNFGRGGLDLRHGVGIEKYVRPVLGASFPIDDER